MSPRSSRAATKVATQRARPVVPAVDLIVALDFPKGSDARRFVRELHKPLRAHDVILKVGSELFAAEGPAFVRKLVGDGFRVFLDLKFHDIPNTVAAASQQAARMGVSLFTVHLSGGREMIRHAAQALDLESRAGVGRSAKGRVSLRPKILGVSVLTSFGEESWSEVCQAMHAGSPAIADSVEGLVAAGVLWGVDGIVCSTQEVGLISQRFSGLYTVVPGIRLAGASAQDQARVFTPAQAREAGARAIVVGRPITQADRPAEIMREILAQLGRSV